MKQTLLTGLIGMLGTAVKGAADNTTNVKAGLQSEVGKAYQDHIQNEVQKNVKGLKEAQTPEKKELANLVAGLQSQITAIASHATVAAANLVVGRPLSHRSQFAKAGLLSAVPESAKVKMGEVQSFRAEDTKELNAGLQSFSPINVDTFVAYSTAYNIAASKQSAFSELFYKSIMLDPTIASFDLEIKVIQTYTNNKAELGANPYEKGLRSLIKQISDGTSLVKEETKLYPINRAENEDKILKDLAWDQVVAGATESVAPLKSGEKIGLLSACVSTALAASGVQDSSDTLTTENRVTDLFFSVTGDVDVAGTPTEKTDWLKLPVRVNSLNKFVRKINGKHTEMALGETFSLVYPVKELKTFVLGTGNGVLDGLSDTYSLKLEITLYGSLDIDSGNVVVDPKVKLLDIVDADGVVVTGSVDSDVVAIKDIFGLAAKTAEGYSIECYRLNDNLRQKGQRITQNSYYCSFPLSYHAPRHVDTPAINFAGDNGDSTLETAVNYTGFEMDQVAIQNLLEYTDMVRQVAKADYTDDELYKIIGPAAYFVTPSEDRRNIDVSKILSTTSSSTFMKDLRAVISYQVREMTIKLAKESVIQDALRVIAGDDTVFVAVGIDAAYASFVDAESIDLPANYKVVVEATNNTQMSNKIVVALSKESSSADKANILDRGWMVWYPDVAAKLQITEDGATKNTFVYIPGYTHINNMPVCGVIDISGMEVAVAKSGQRVVRIGSTGQIIDL